MVEGHHHGTTKMKDVICLTLEAVIYLKRWQFIKRILHSITCAYTGPFLFHHIYMKSWASVDVRAYKNEKMAIYLYLSFNMYNHSSLFVCVIIEHCLFYTIIYNIPLFIMKYDYHWIVSNYITIMTMRLCSWSVKSIRHFVIFQSFGHLYIPVVSSGVMTRVPIWPLTLHPGNMELRNIMYFFTNLTRIVPTGQGIIWKRRKLQV